MKLVFLLFIGTQIASAAPLIDRIRICDRILSFVDQRSPEWFLKQVQELQGQRAELRNIRDPQVRSDRMRINTRLKAILKRIHRKHALWSPEQVIELRQLLGWSDPSFDDIGLPRVLNNMIGSLEADNNHLKGWAYSAVAHALSFYVSER